MSGVNEFMAQMAEHVPTDLLIKHLHEACAAYMDNRSAHNYNQIITITQVLLTKECVKQVGTPEELVRKSDLMRAGYELLNTKNKQN